jgi:hypothetical protein
MNPLKCSPVNIGTVLFEGKFGYFTHHGAYAFVGKIDNTNATFLMIGFFLIFGNLH